jgi:hypothetical protein
LNYWLRFRYLHLLLQQKFYPPDHAERASVTPKTLLYGEAPFNKE